MILLNENMYVGHNTELLAKTRGEPTVVDIVPVAIQAGRSQSTFSESYLMRF